MPKNKFLREKKKVLMELMASSETSKFGLKLYLDPNEVFSNLTRSEVEPCLTKILEKFQSIKNRHKDLKRIHVADSEVLIRIMKENYILKEKFAFLEKYNSALKRKSKDHEKEILLEALIDSKDVIKKYDMDFKKILARNTDRSKMSSMIYGTSKNGKRDLGNVSHKHSRFKPNSKHKDTKSISLFYHFT